MVGGPLEGGWWSGAGESEASILDIYCFSPNCKDDNEEPVGTQVAGHGDAPKPGCAYPCLQES